MNATTSHTTYANAGVNIDAGNELVEAIKPMVKATHRNGTLGNIGGFGGLFDIKAAGYNDPILVAATDGVGTKLKLAFAANKHNTVGIDLVAMCVNDLIVQGAEPLFFLDYFATGGLDNKVAEEVISGISEGCIQANCALIGGETAEMPGMYQSGHYDLAGFAVGAVERGEMLPNVNNIKEGDSIIGLSSNGLHSNGFSLVRYLLAQQGISLSDNVPFDSTQTLENILLTPTKIYVKSCLAAIKEKTISALAHITGGGLTENIPRILPEHLAAQINLNSWEQPPIFTWLRDIGNVAQDEMLKTFNCGIGMVIITPKEQCDQTISLLTSHGEQAHIIGQITKRTAQPVTYT